MGITLFLLVYDKKVILPIDKTKSLMIHKYMMSIIEEIPYVRKEARLMIQRV